MINARTTIMSSKDMHNGHIVALTLHTTFVKPGAAMATEIPDENLPWHNALGACEKLKHEIVDVLRHGKDQYPATAGSALLEHLPWQGLESLVHTCRAAQDPDLRLELSFSPLNCGMSLELAPLPADFCAQGWLDAACPVYRTFRPLICRQARRCEDRSLAIIHQDEPQHQALAEDLRRMCARQFGQQLTAIDTYHGGSYLAQPENRYAFLDKVFREHRAVVFLGHFLLADAHTRGGWILSDGNVLQMSELEDFLGVRPDQTPAQLGRKGPPVPEVIFASCCASSGADPAGPYRPGLLYPEMFLRAGVRFFIGTSTILAVPNNQISLLPKLIYEFFQGWVNDPADAVGHLYRAKRAIGFPLMSSLFQIYASQVSQPPEPEVPTLPQSVDSDIQPGDQLCDYTLQEMLWSDSYARTFLARRGSTRHLIQVLDRKWQDSPQLEKELIDAVRRLRSTRLPAGLLVPDRHEMVQLRRDRTEHPLSILVLVYDRPQDEQASHWRRLQAVAGDDPSYGQHVLRRARQLADCVARLHAGGMAHGNVCPSNVLLWQPSANQQEQIVLKDAWVWRTSLGRCVEPPYAPAEAAVVGDASEARQADMWGLGMTLHELAAGSAPSPSTTAAETGQLLSGLLKNHDPAVPEALVRVVRECLSASPQLRPASEDVARQFASAVRSGGAYWGQFEDDFIAYTRAGRRLFAVVVDDLQTFEKTLHRLSVNRYHFYVAAPEQGLCDRTQAYQVLPWISPDQSTGPMPSYLVDQANASGLLPRIAQLRPGADGLTPLVLIRGAGWWQSGLRSARQLKLCQSADAGGPVVVIADDVPWHQTGLGLSLQWLKFPPLEPTELFELIQSMPKNEDWPVEAVDAETATQLALALRGCDRRELFQTLRLCVLRFGAIDARAVMIRDEQRQRLFRNLTAASYTPTSSLIDPQHVGLAPGLERKILTWAECVRTTDQRMSAVLAPRRLLIRGPSGSGKSVLAHSLGARLHRPLVTVDFTRCLRGGLGDSEKSLMGTLAMGDSLRNAFVLLENVQTLFGTDAPQPVAGAAPPQTTSAQATLARMSGLLLNWLDGISADVIVAMTMNDRMTVPAQLKRRAEWVIHLSLPQDIPQRAAIFTALFHRFALDDLAQDRPLMEMLASRTTAPLASPLSRWSGDTDERVHLLSGADIEYWLYETILLHGRATQPLDRQFWLDAVQDVPSRKE